jgi:hypothetical protein
MANGNRNLTGGSTAIIDCDGCHGDISFEKNEGIWQVETPTGVKFLCDECGWVWCDPEPEPDPEPVTV